MTTWPFLSHGRGHRTGTVLTQSFRTIFRRLQTSASSPGAICTAGAGGREGTVTCFASETTVLTATEKPSLRCEPRPEPACSRTRATSGPSHALPGPPRAAPATLPRPWAADRPREQSPVLETGRQRSRSGSCRPALRLRCQRVAGPGTGPFGSCVHCPPARRQSWARKPIAGPLRPSRCDRSGPRPGAGGAALLPGSCPPSPAWSCPRAR